MGKGVGGGLRSRTCRCEDEATALSKKKKKKELCRKERVLPGEPDRTKMKDGGVWVVKNAGKG